MHKSAKQTAAISMAALGITLFAAGCSEADRDSAAATATSAADAATDAAGDAADSATSAMTSAFAPEPTMITGADGVDYTVEGVLLEKYQDLDDESKTALGAPTGEQQTNPDNGVYQQFDGGVIISSDEGSYVVWGLIRDKWNELGGSQGELGYPTSDETVNDAGQKQTTFQHGTVTWAEGATEAVVAPAH